MNSSSSHPLTDSRVLAWAFVLIWGSGFLATKVGLQYAAPFTFLCLRFAVGIACLLLVLALRRPQWPRGRLVWLHIIVAGLLTHGIHLSGSHYGQNLGMSAGLVAIILGAQPLVTALIAARWLGEAPTHRQWLGIGLGLIGVCIVVWHKVDMQVINAANFTAVIIALAALTAGTLYQRRFVPEADLFVASLIQFVASLLLLAPFAWFVEGARIDSQWQLWLAVTFLVVFASILAVSALHTLMRRGEASRVASILYLPPIVAVVCEWLLFAVTPTALTLLGIVITSVGVGLATRK